MVKKKASRAKGRERKALSSSARAAFIESKEETQDKPEWQEGLDIHVPKKEKEQSTEDAEYAQRLQNAKLTAKQKKRIGVLKQRKQQKEQREALYASLAKNQLSTEHLQILQSSARIGQTYTERQKLKLALKKNRLGIATPDVSIYREVELPDEKDFPATCIPDPVTQPQTSTSDQTKSPKNRKRKRKGAVERNSKPTKGFFVPISEDDDDQRPTKRQKVEQSPEADFNSDEEANTTKDLEMKTTNEPEMTKEELVNKEENKSETEENADEANAQHVESLPKKAIKHVIELNRPEELEETRKQLPIYMEEQIIMEKITENPVCIICGETGSGKTTQVPQFMYEGGYGHENTSHSGMIAITQPRRVAAVSVAKRVAAEMGVDLGQEVGYQIRYQKKISHKTKLKFMTDGVLLRELHSDFLLARYSAIVLDEAHERGINTDILIGLLSRIVPLRAKLAESGQERDGKLVEPLKLIIMSATLRVEDFVSNKTLFDPAPPVVHINARMFPVTIHFNRVTPLGSYDEEVFKKTSKIHGKLPPGGILVFMTGQQEIEMMCRRLRDAFPLRKLANEDSMDTDEIEYDGMHVLPLYSLLRTEQQLQVFQDPPKGSRLVVVATNVAETSVTIPGIKYVVDTGKVKAKTYEGTSGMSRFEVQWTSQASCDQRAGRAGRVSAGHCYRLFSSAVFNDYFPKFTPPEITQTPIDGVVLQMKCMGIDRVEEFPFPTAPDRTAIRQAIITLQNLGALEPDNDSLGENEKLYPKVTKLGKTLSMFPVSPRFAKMLSLGNQGGCMPYIIGIVAALSVQSYPLLRMSDQNDINDDKSDDESEELPKISKRKQKEVKNAHTRWMHPLSDLLTVLRAIGAYEHAVFVQGINASAFCKENYLHERSMKEIHLLRLQLKEIIDTITDSEIEEGSVEMEGDVREKALARVSNNNKLQRSHLKPPTVKCELMLRQIITSGLSDRLATLARNQPLVLEEENQRPSKHQYICCTTNKPVYIHPTSVLFNKKPLPEYVVFTELHDTPKKTYMKGLTVISPSWLPNLSKNLCGVPKILQAPEPTYEPVRDVIMCHARPSYSGGWNLPPQQVEYPEELDAYKWFARLLLAGKVCSYFAQFQEQMTAKPSLITSAWNISKVNQIVEPLARKKIRTKKALLQEWTQNSSFLLEAVQLWIPVSLYATLQTTWPPKS